MLFVEETEFEKHAQESRERMQTADVFSVPYGIILSFALVMLVGTYLLDVMDPRKSFATRLMRFEAETEKEGSIWLGVSLKADFLYVFTDTHKAFMIPRKLASFEDISPLADYLKSRVQQKLFHAGLSRQASSTEFTVVLALDQSLRYAHIRPILQSISQAKINNFAFETIPNDNVKLAKKAIKARSHHQ